MPNHDDRDALDFALSRTALTALTLPLLRAYLALSGNSEPEQRPYPVYLLTTLLSGLPQLLRDPASCFYNFGIYFDGEWQGVISTVAGLAAAMTLNDFFASVGVSPTTAAAAVSAAVDLGLGYLQRRP